SVIAPQIAMLCRAATQMPRSPGSEGCPTLQLRPAVHHGRPDRAFAGILHTDHRLCCGILQQRRSTDHQVSRRTNGSNLIPLQRTVGSKSAAWNHTGDAAIHSEVTRRPSTSSIRYSEGGTMSVIFGSTARV